MVHCDPRYARFLAGANEEIEFYLVFVTGWSSRNLALHPRTPTRETAPRARTADPLQEGASCHALREKVEVRGNVVADACGEGCGLPLRLRASDAQLQLDLHQTEKTMCWCQGFTCQTKCKGLRYAGLDSSCPRRTWWDWTYQRTPCKVLDRVQWRKKLERENTQRRKRRGVEHNSLGDATIEHVMCGRYLEATNDLKKEFRPGKHAFALQEEP